MVIYIKASLKAEEFDPNIKLTPDVRPKVLTSICPHGDALYWREVDHVFLFGFCDKCRDKGLGD